MLKTGVRGGRESEAEFVVFDETDEGVLYLHDVASDVHASVAVVKQLTLHLPVRTETCNALRHRFRKDKAVALKAGDVDEDMGLSHLLDDDGVRNTVENGDGFVVRDGHLAVVKVTDDGEVCVSADGRG